MSEQTRMERFRLWIGRYGVPSWRRTRPGIRGGWEWMTYPLRVMRFYLALALYRQRPHRFYCPACGYTSADPGLCGGSLGTSAEWPVEIYASAHRWHSTGNGFSRTWICEPMLPYGSAEPVA